MTLPGGGAIMTNTGRHIHIDFDDEVGLQTMGYRCTGRGYEGPTERYRAWTLVFLAEGQFKLKTDGDTRSAQAPMLMLLDPFNRYRLTSDGCEFLYAQFTFRFHPDRPIRPNLTLPLMDVERLSDLNKQFAEMSRRVAGCDDTQLSSLRRPVHELILKLVHAITQPLPEGQNHADAEGGRLVAIKQFLAHNVESPLNLKRAAAAFYLSPSHLSRLFRQATGQTLKQYHHALRMQRAADLLTHTDRTITQIADDLGFSTVHHFSRRFKRFHKVSPLEYRCRRRDQGEASTGR
jgi:AraC-like DNA-binding protein